MTAPRLRIGQVITSDEGRRYRIERRIGDGGYGQVYLAHQLAQRSDRKRRTVCVKVCGSASDWHGEAHFGGLLAGYPEVIELLDTFAFSTGSRTPTRYVLVSEYLHEGTVADRIQNGQWAGWSPTDVRREILRILKVLALMHAAGVTHRDIKPDNVFLRDGHLVLGDFGISKHSLTPQRSPIDAYTPAYSPTDIEDRRHWATWLDVFQVGLLASALLTGEDWTNVDIARIRTVDAPEDLKCWIWHATAHRGMRYVDATEARDALAELKWVDMRTNSRSPSSLRGHHVVVTGKFDTGTQHEMSQLIQDAGATVQRAVTDDTTVLVRAPRIANTVGGSEGRKLYAVRERKRRGQRIQIITENRLRTLVGADDPSTGRVLVSASPSSR